MHNFGIFGGSNGYWRIDLLRRTRLHDFMLTEDFDASMRITMEGCKIKTDPYIISRELASTSLEALLNQRMRWAQGWFQVSIKHAFGLLGSEKTTIRQKIGIWHLLIWREIYPWISLQIIPIILFWAVLFDGFHNIDWFVPLFIVTSLVTLGTGPAQIFYIWQLSHESVARYPCWYVLYAIYSLFTPSTKTQLHVLFKSKS